MNTDETTEDLIDKLALGLEPVPRLRSPGRRATLWAFGATLYVVLAVVGMGWLVGSIAGWPASFWVAQILAVATGVLASAAAFASVVPGASNRWRAWTVPVALLWLATLVVASPAQIDWAAVPAASHEWLCVGVILAGGAPLMIVLTSLLRRGAPLTPAATAGFSALAVAALANVAACMSLPHANGAVTFAWHGGVVVAAVLVAALCGRLLFAWRAATPQEN